MSCTDLDARNGATPCFCERSLQPTHQQTRLSAYPLPPPFRRSLFLPYITSSCGCLPQRRTRRPQRRSCSWSASAALSSAHAPATHEEATARSCTRAEWRRFCKERAVAALAERSGGKEMGAMRLATGHPLLQPWVLAWLRWRMRRPQRGAARAHSGGVARGARDGGTGGEERREGDGARCGRGRGRPCYCHGC